MMILRLIPNVVMELPLTTYYGITMLGLYVGKSGITSCNLKIGNETIAFKAGNEADNTLLPVNGDPSETPTYWLASDHEKIVLDLPNGASLDLDGAEIALHHYLCYSVPRKKEITGQN